MKPAASRGRTIVRSGCWIWPRPSSARASRITSAHSRQGSSSRTCGPATTRLFTRASSLAGVHHAGGGVGGRAGDRVPMAGGHRAGHGGVPTVGDWAASLIHLRGHTPGSLAVLYDAGGRLAGAPHVFTGDSLFPGGVGKTNYGSGYTTGRPPATG